MTTKAPALALLLVVPGCFTGVATDSDGDYDDEGSAPDFPGSGTDGAGDPLDGGELTCFYGEGDDRPAAAIEHAFEIVDGTEVVHVRLTLDPRFVDNTYGAMSIGWADSKKGSHEFKQLVGSDHAQLQLIDGNDSIGLEIAIDYISEDASAPSGYRSLGASGGDGKILVGDTATVIDTATSLDRNLNERGLGQYVENSPPTNSAYDPSAEAPAWDYRVVYEVWADMAAFGSAGFDRGSIEFVHASPAKGGDNTIVVDPRPCPEDWCQNPYGCEPEPDCNDPDGCDNDPTDTPECVEDIDCPTNEFCNEEGTCLPFIG